MEPASRPGRPAPATRLGTASGFNYWVRYARQSIEAGFETNAALLRATQSFFSAQPRVTANEFQTYAGLIDLRQRYPGSAALGYSKRVRSPGDQDALAAEMQSIGRGDFRIWPDSTATERQPIVLLEPLDHSNQAEIGFDMQTDPVRRAAMERARDTGQPAASRMLPPNPKAGEQAQPTFVVFMPVYAGGITPETVAERREALEGFIHLGLRSRDFVGATLLGPAQIPLAIEIFDGPEPEASHLLFQTRLQPEEQSAVPMLSRVIAFDAAGQPWAMRVSTTSVFDAQSRGFLTPYIFLAGLAISIPVTLAVRAQARARLQAERHAAVLRDTLAARRESEARRSAILDSSLDSVIAMDERGRITEFNSCAESAFGYRREDVLGKDLFELIIPESYRDSLRRGFEHYLKTGTGAEPVLGERLEARARTADGSEFTAEVTVTEISLMAGREFTAHIRDITERKLADARLHEEMATVETLHQIGNSFATKLDLQALMQEVTDAARVISGAQFGVFFYQPPSPDGVEGREPIFTVSGVSRDVFANCARPRSTALLGPTLEGRAAIRLDDATKDERAGRGVSPDEPSAMPSGHPSVRSYLGVPVVTASGNVLGAILLGHSARGRFNERHESMLLAVAAQAAISLDNASLYRAAEEAREAAEVANRAKDEFLAILSHELRAPLTAILGWCQLLSRGKRSESEIARGLDRIERSAKAQTRLISDLLDVSRIVSGRLRLEVQWIDLEPVIEAAIDAVRSAAEAKEILLRQDLDGAVSPVVGDPSRLQQVFWNLLSNAVKFTQRGGEVRVTLARNGGNAVVTVQDSGCGIPPRELGRIFDRFHQLEGSTTRKAGGLGLGLAIVRHLVELHGGASRADSAGEGHGSTFTVELPIAAQRPLQPPTGVERALGPLRDGARPGDRANLSGIRVLVVDDDPEARDVIEAALTSASAEVRVAPSVDAALEEMARARPDVLVSDIAMPERDGYELIRTVRARAASDGGRIPALALTAFARVEDRRRALLAGFQMHASKPIDPDELIAMVASLAQGTAEPERAPAANAAAGSGPIPRPSYS